MIAQAGRVAEGGRIAVRLELIGAELEFLVADATRTAVGDITCVDERSPREQNEREG